MKRTMEFRRELTMGADRVWATVAGVGGVDKWFPGILSCRVEGHGPGARRYCEMAGGAKLKETVVGIDEQTRTFRYTVDEGLPVPRYEGILQVRGGHDGGAEIVWTVSFEGEPDAVAAMEAMLAQLAPAGLEGLANVGLKAA